MASPKKWKADLKRAAKRRERRPQPQVVIPPSLKAPGNVERRMIRDHLELLQSIETALLEAFRSSSGDVDDQVVEAALRSAITGKEAAESKTKWAAVLLEAARSAHDWPEGLWTDGLRVIYSSLCFHSSRKAGDTSYLSFVGTFVP